jgi:NADH:ubiquinone oxidoreductase subunit F (NADH-binding)
MVAVPDTYIVGEETALICALQGQPALPARRPPFPIESGIGGAPTLVQNVETVAHLPYIITFGATAYRSLGANDGGVTLCTFGPEFVRAGVRLVPLGVRLRDIVEQHGGGLRSGLGIKAVQPGGPSAGFLPASALDVKFDDASLKHAGSALGCAAIRAFSEEDDMVRVVAEQMDFFAAASCGQCPACRMTTQMLSTMTRQILAGRGTAALLRQVPVLIERNADKGICGFLKMPGPPMLSVLRHFPAELDRYLQRC